MLKLIALTLPLGLDTLLVSSAVGASGLPTGRRLRIAVLFALFEGTMPLLGLALGAPLSDALGSGADYLAGAVLVGLGLYAVASGDEAAEAERAGRLVHAWSWGTVLVALSISLDELAIGFTLGVLGLPVLATLIVIVVQAFVLSQLGLWLGTRVGEARREGAEALAGIALIAVGLVLIIVHAVT